MQPTFTAFTNSSNEVVVIIFLSHRYKRTIIRSSKQKSSWTTHTTTHQQPQPVKEMTEVEHHKDSMDASVLVQHLTSSVYDEIPTSSVIIEPKLVPMGRSYTYEDMSGHVLQQFSASNELKGASVGPYEMMASVFPTEKSKTVTAEKSLPQASANETTDYGDVKIDF